MRKLLATSISCGLLLAACGDDSGGADAASAPDGSASIDAATDPADATPNYDAAPNYDATPSYDATPDYDASVSVPQELLVNGDFAAGLAPWTSMNNPANPGTQFPHDPNVVFSVDGLTETASSGQSEGPAARDLIQDFVVPAGLVGATFSLMFFQDAPEEPLDPANVLVIEKDPLDESGNGLNENAFRIDIIDPDMDEFYSAILFELYMPIAGVGAPDALMSVTFDDPALLAFLQANEGQNLRLRLGHVESTFPWLVAVDDISLIVVAP